MIGSRSALLIAALVGGVVLTPSRGNAQWWRSSPADFEDCADAAEKVVTKEARTAALAECNAKFAGRRKLGGGYTYFDFMQNRSFDIAGPNPTPEEQKHIDLQYTVFLDQERQKTIAAAFTAKQQSQIQVQAQRQLQAQPPPKLQQASLTNEKAQPVPLPRPRAAATVNELRLRAKTASCPEHSFSCDWPRLSESIKDLKKALFGSPPVKPKRG